MKKLLLVVIFAFFDFLVFSFTCDDVMKCGDFNFNTEQYDSNDVGIFMCHLGMPIGSTQRCLDPDCDNEVTLEDLRIFSDPYLRQQACGCRKPPDEPPDDPNEAIEETLENYDVENFDFGTGRFYVSGLYLDVGSDGYPLWLGVSIDSSLGILEIFEEQPPIRLSNNKDIDPNLVEMDVVVDTIHTVTGTYCVGYVIINNQPYGKIAYLGEEIFIKFIPGMSVPYTIDDMLLTLIGENWLKYEYSNFGSWPR